MSVLLLASACGLAAWLSQERVGRVLSQYVQPPGWGIAFRAPGQFRSEEIRTADAATIATYSADLSTGGSAELTVWNIQLPADLENSELCDQIAGVHAPLMSLMFPPPPPKRPESLGPFLGLEAAYPGVPMVVRAAVVAGRQAYAVALRVQGGAIDEKLYRAFAAVCDSIERSVDRGGRSLQPPPA